MVGIRILWALKAWSLWRIRIVPSTPNLSPWRLRIVSATWRSCPSALLMLIRRSSLRLQSKLHVHVLVWLFTSVSLMTNYSHCFLIAWSISSQRRALLSISRDNGRRVIIMITGRGRARQDVWLVVSLVCWHWYSILHLISAANFVYYMFILSLDYSGELMEAQLDSTKHRISHSKAPGVLGHVVKPGFISFYSMNGKTYAVAEGRWWLMKVCCNWYLSLQYVYFMQLLTIYSFYRILSRHTGSKMQRIRRWMMTLLLLDKSALFVYSQEKLDWFESKEPRFCWMWVHTF